MEFKWRTVTISDLVGADTVDLMGKIKIQVADATYCVLPRLLTPRKPVLMNCAEPYMIKIKTDVTKVLPTWTPLNFEGFYYSIDEGIGTENLYGRKLKWQNYPIR